jgi:diadenosine tetraphosphate (Ap4A) HIT family hydrolase
MNTDQKKSFVLVSHARSKQQKEIMQRIEHDGVCPFCAENFLKYHTEPIIKETDSWILTKNFSPYEGSVHHFLFVYKPSHINTPGQMTNESRAELFDLVDELQTKHSISGGAILMRFGDGEINGSSVEHLHAHLIVGVPKGDNTEGLKVKVGYKNI